MKHTVLFCATTIVAVLLCFSVVAFGLATIRPAAADVSASGANGQLTPNEIVLSLPAPAQSTSTIAAQSQTPTIPLVPFQLTIADQKVSEPTSLSALTTIGASQTGPSAGLTANMASSNSAPSADSVTTNVKPGGSGSLALMPVSALGGPTGLILVSYGTAIVVLGVMRYWSFSFDEGTESSREMAESSSELNNANVVYVRGSAYSTLDNVEYGHTAEGR
ncbi:MAG: hypothetical protein ABSD89_06360 [Halobacteriota archaeon]|jgi:hypothetical protein